MIPIGPESRKRGSNSTSTILYLVLSFVVTALLLALTIYMPSSWIDLALFAGYFLTILAVIIAWRKSGLNGTAFWYTSIAAYPLLTPFLWHQLMGFPRFALISENLQSVEAMAFPIFAASFATLGLALFIDPKRLAPDVGARSGVTKSHQASTTITLNQVFLVVSCVLAMVFAWLAEPGPFLIEHTVREIRETRIQGTRFASGVWLTLSVLAVGAHTRLKGDERKWGTWLLVISLVFSLVWFLGHGRRVEIFGLAIFLFLVYQPQRLARSAHRLPSWLQPRYLFLMVFVLIGALLGYYRTQLSIELGPGVYWEAPGGSGYNLLTYLAAFESWRSSELRIFPGETYLWQIINLPPEAFGLEQAPRAYEVISSYHSLLGGSYWLMEPMMNFGFWGVPIFTGFIVVLANWSARAVRRFLCGRGSYIAFLVGGAFFGNIFRTLWYGPESVVNTVIMAFMLGGIAQLFVNVNKKIGYRRIGV